jgi:hypothetical protein
MLIGMTDIATLGFSLLEVKGHLNLPSRKKILDRALHTEDNLRYEEFDVKLKLMGKFLTAVAGTAAVEQLKTLLKSATSHAFTIPTRDLYFLGLVRNGMEVILYDKVIVINMNVTVTECQPGNLTI